MAFVASPNPVILWVAMGMSFVTVVWPSLVMAVLSAVERSARSVFQSPGVASLPVTAGFQEPGRLVGM